MFSSDRSTNTVVLDRIASCMIEMIDVRCSDVLFHADCSTALSIAAGDQIIEIDLTDLSIQPWVWFGVSWEFASHSF